MLGAGDKSEQRQTPSLPGGAYNLVRKTDISQIILQTNVKLGFLADILKGRYMTL